MKYALVALLIIACAVVAYASVFSGIVFDSDESAVAFVISLEARIQHSQEWSYCDHASPTIHLTDGRKVLIVVDAVKPYLTPEEREIVVEIDSSLLPSPPQLPQP